MLTAVSLGVVSALPGEDRTLGVRHESQVTTISAAEPCDSVGRAVGVRGVRIIGVACDDVVAVAVVGEVELPFAVSYPHTE